MGCPTGESVLDQCPLMTHPQQPDSNIKIHNKSQTKTPSNISSYFNSIYIDQH